MQFIMSHWSELLTRFGIGLGGAMFAYAGRWFFNWFDFLPRRLDTIGIGTYFASFYASAPGDQYNHALFIEVTNHGGLPLYIVRAVYIPGRMMIPIYVNARKSQKKTRGYELKFGEQWKHLDSLLSPNQSVKTYLPLAESVSDIDVPQGKRGNLYLEYVFAGKTGIHFAPM